jgi:metallo-beta-lactamase family protein
MKLTFWGAAKQVTGSMYLLELDDDYRILIDCGFNLEKVKSDEEEENTPSLYSGSVFPFDASLINVVVLTHAHIDHSGNIPNLVREGFEGQVVCTNATYHLAQLLLADSAMLHQKKWKKYEREQKKPSSKKSKKNYISQPAEWYVQRHVNQAEAHFFSLQFNRRFQLTKGVHITLIPTGHLLGAANVLIEIEEKGQQKRLLFSGDIGRSNYPLLPDPEPAPQADYLVCETTYGNRKHADTQEAEKILYEIIQEACVVTNGRLIIPAFSVGRTQALLFVLHKLSLQGKLPPIKVFSDSPLAYKSTLAYNKFIHLLNEEAQGFYQAHQSLFDFENLIYVEDLKTSRLISNYNEPCIIVSSSGMIQGGRIESHIKANIQNPYATILMIGYAAEGTIGHDLIHGKKSISIKGKDMPLMAKVKRTDIFSGHGDQDDLLRFVRHQSPEALQKVFLVHGELSAMQDFKSLLETQGYQNKVEIPSKGQSFDL